MSGTLIQSEFTYRSGTSPNLYQFTIVSNQAGVLLVRDIQDPYGTVLSPYTQIPQTVTNDISDAMIQVEELLALTSVVNGTLSFASETQKTVSFAEPMVDTTYRVHITSNVFAPFRITNKLTTGFTIQAGATISGDVGYDVFI